MDSLKLLSDSFNLVADLSDDDDEISVVSSKVLICRSSSSLTIDVRVMDLADALRGAFERALGNGSQGVSPLWDSGRKAGVTSKKNGMVELELPLGSEPLNISREHLIRFILECYSFGLKLWL